MEFNDDLKITRIEVDWMERYANTPQWLVHVEELPEHKPYTLNYAQHGTLYVAETWSGYVNFYAYSGPDRGFGGRIFPILVDGKPKDLIGPWSSRAGAVNMFTHHRVVEVVFVLPNGSRISGALTMYRLLVALQLLKPEGITAVLEQPILRNRGQRAIVPFRYGEQLLLPAHYNHETGAWWLKRERFINGSRVLRHFNVHKWDPLQLVDECLAVGIYIYPTMRVAS